jgi:hypothetical protein
MYFALMIIIALIAAALILLLEHRSEAYLLKHEDGSCTKIPKKTQAK